MVDDQPFDHPFGDEEPKRPPLTAKRRAELTEDVRQARLAGDHEAADYGDSILFLDERERSDVAGAGVGEVDADRE